VVEQPGFVAAGREFLRDAPINFFESAEAAEAAGPHDVLLVSTTVQYLEDPGAAVAGWRDQKFTWLLFNNVPLHVGAPDRIAVQRVPAEIYPASYPVRFFNREKFLAPLAADYRIAAEFAGEAVWPVGWRRYASTGLLLERRKTP
jgi:putative methyltransferase (TIGR04325 family)